MTDQTPQSTFDEKFEAILRDIWCYAGFGMEERGYTNSDAVYDAHPELTGKAKAAIKALVLEEVVSDGGIAVYGGSLEGLIEQLKFNAKQELRAQQRSIITKGE